MSERRLSDEVILDLINEISPAAVAHSQRCRHIAEFILTSPGSQRIFLKRMYSDELLTAISLHDFGKAFIDRECSNKKYCKKASQRKEYRRHIDKAEEYIKANSDVFETEPASFDRFLLDCSTMHHEAVDGSGFNRGAAGRGIPLSARLCAVVDFIDGVLDLDFAKGLNTQKALDELEKASGKTLDPRICELVLRHKITFGEVCEELYAHFRGASEGRTQVVIKYSGIYSAYNYEFIGYDTEAVIRDADFGEVSSEAVKLAAVKTEMGARLGRIIRHRTFNQAEYLSENNVDIGRLAIFESPRALAKKSYVAELQKLLPLYELAPDRLTVRVPEEVILNMPPELEANLLSLRKLGIRLGVDGFGELCRSFDAFEGFKFDEIRLSRNFVERMDDSRERFEAVAGMIAVARNLGMDVVCSDIISPEDENRLVGMGVNRLGGILYGGPMTADELILKFDNEIEGDAM